MGWGTEARGTRQVAGGRRQRQAAGGSAGAGSFRRSLPRSGSFSSGPGRTSRASRRRSVSR
eukprot:scaffold132266_cov42-Phaeocystis_antarctica.AAC.1